MSIRNTECLARLQSLGISWDDACALRRISMTLHRWHELECGDSNDYASSCITRGEKRFFPERFEHNDDGAPYIERHVHTESKPRFIRIPDRERGAQKRLATIMARYPTLKAYIQGDPRGAALYILQPSDIPPSQHLPDGTTLHPNIDSYYSRGVAVYR